MTCAGRRRRRHIASISVATSSELRLGSVAEGWKLRVIIISDAGEIQGGRLTKRLNAYWVVCSREPVKSLQQGCDILRIGFWMHERHIA